MGTTDQLVECVPNFSEGRSRAVIDKLAIAIESVPGVAVLDVHMDADHNRSVITFAAAPEGAVEAAVRVVSRAAELIDLRQHRGEHPRLGATDVLPFVPLRGVTMAQCVAMARAAGERVARELGIPVYFYERAARRPDRVNLEDVRRGGFELLREEIATSPERAPDAGRPEIHETAGAIIIGARPLLLAYNINLRADDVSIARRIARAVRGRDGGLRYLKALGFDLKTRSLVQVSMNLVDHEKTPLHQAFEAVRREAERYGVAVAGSEIVGLVPQDALLRAAEYHLRIENFDVNRVLENRIEAAFEGKLARDAGASAGATGAAGAKGGAGATGATGTTGGGAAAAEAAALGAALGEMVARLTAGRQEFADVEDQARGALAELGPLREQLLRAAQEDAASFARVIEARRLGQENEKQKIHRRSRIEAALKGAALVPLEIAAVAVQVLELLEVLADIGNPRALSDVACGAQLSLAAVTAARYNVLVNTAAIEDEEFNVEHRARADDLTERARDLASRIESVFMESIG